MFGDTPLIMVEDQATLERVMESLKDEPCIGIDTEADSFHHYQEKVCLIQISDLTRDIIIDPLQIDDISCIGPVLANRDQVKILHGGDYDIVSLKRDHGFALHNVFDTMIASQFLALPHIGLADLIQHFFGHKIGPWFQYHALNLHSMDLHGLHL